MSANNGLLIECGSADGRGVRSVSATLGTKQHRDKFDPDDSFKRAKFRDVLINKFDLDEEAHEYIEGKILAAADTAGSEPLIQCSTVRLCDVQPETVDWLWYQRIAIGKLTLIVGDPGQGKSFLTLDIAARVSRGAAWPDNAWEPQPAGDVILLTAEDDLGDTIRPRLDALEADVNRIIAIKGAKFEDAERMVNLSTDLQSIRKVAGEANGPRLLVIDPVSAYLGKIDSHNNAEVRGVLAPLAELASELRIAVVAVSHLRKGEGAAMYRTMGSLAFIAAARSAWVVARDETDQRRRLLLPIKSNIAPDVGGLAFTIEPHGLNDAPVVCWEREPVSVAADDAIGHGRRKRGPAPTERMQVAEWLRSRLADGPQSKAEVIVSGEGYGFTQRTIERAFREIGGVSNASGFPPAATWSVNLATNLAKGNTTGELGELGEHAKNPNKTTTTSLFLRSESACSPSSESVAQPYDVNDALADFEAERRECAGGGEVQRY
jgi:hypothetical protein